MSVATKMTAIADKIRSLLGITGTMKLNEIASNLGAVNSEVDTQADLINQISTVLETKAVGGGGVETCSLRIVNNNMDNDYEAVITDSGTDLEYDGGLHSESCIIYCDDAREFEIVKGTAIVIVGCNEQPIVSTSDNSDMLAWQIMQKVYWVGGFASNYPDAITITIS